MKESLSVVHKAIELFEGPAEFARRLGMQIGKPISRQAVNNWKLRGEFPKDVIVGVHMITRLPYKELLSPPPWEVQDQDEHDQQVEQQATG